MAVPVRRFAIYRNNVVLSLAQALESRFPAAVSLVGEAFFRAMAKVFVRAHPPRSQLLATFGDEMPGFAANFAPAQEVPYLADVMRLEVAYSQAYHAADAKAATAQALQHLNENTLGSTCVVLHPAVRLLRSVHPVVRLWQMNTGLAPLEPIEDWQGEDGLITRPELDVFVSSLPKGGFEFLAVLQSGGSLSTAFEAAFSVTETFDMAGALAGLITAGVAINFIEKEK
eukprot:gene16328-16505_t